MMSFMAQEPKGWRIPDARGPTADNLLEGNRATRAAQASKPPSALAIEVLKHPADLRPETFRQGRRG
jgi:hypothetical protein